MYSFNSNKKNTLQPENLNTDLAISMFQWLQAWVCKSVSQFHQTVTTHCWLPTCEYYYIPSWGGVLFPPTVRQIIDDMQDGK